MKLTYFWIWFLTLIFLLQACENNIDLYNENQEKTFVVYGLLNSTDPQQQVKVRMTSITNAAISEIGADSTEFSASPGLQVSIQEWQRNTYAIYQMKPVRYSKEPGIFMNTRNDLYEARFTPFIDMDYKLIIANPDNGEVVESKIVPVPAPKLGSPNWPWIRYNFSLDADPFNIRFNEVPRVYVYLVRFTIRYIEVYARGDTLLQDGSYVFKPRYVDDPPEYSAAHESFGNEHNQHMSSEYTYNVFNLVIPDRPDVRYRQLICFDVSVWGGDQNLRNYTEYGIKFKDNRKQFFTNINNGIGFFGACSHSDCTGVLPDQDFMDSLPLHYRTARLKFRTELFRSRPVPFTPAADDFLSLIPEIRYDE